jgi:hypothetical protein
MSRRSGRGTRAMSAARDRPRGRARAICLRRGTW